MVSREARVLANNRVAEVSVEAAKNLHGGHQREGQAWFNAVYQFDPEFADSVRGTNDDPFYIGDVQKFIVSYIRYLEERFDNDIA